MMTDLTLKQETGRHLSLFEIKILSLENFKLLYLDDDPSINIIDTDDGMDKFPYYVQETEEDLSERTINQSRSIMKSLIENDAFDAAVILSHNQNFKSFSQYFGNIDDEVENSD
jgi:hypothetical protein